MREGNAVPRHTDSLHAFNHTAHPRQDWVEGVSQEARTAEPQVFPRLAINQRTSPERIQSGKPSHYAPSGRRRTPNPYDLTILFAGTSSYKRTLMSSQYQIGTGGGG